MKRLCCGGRRRSARFAWRREGRGGKGRGGGRRGRESRGGGERGEWRGRAWMRWWQWSFGDDGRMTVPLVRKRGGGEI